MSIHTNTVAGRTAIASVKPIAAAQVERLALHVLRGGLVGILLWLGTFKFTAVEAEAIQPLVANSPLMSWLYAVLSVQGASNLIGASELAIAALLVARPFSAHACAVGSLAAVAMFATTLSFLATTPGLWGFVAGYPLPVLNGTGFFLAKDVFLLGAALASAAEALAAIERA
jgi:uncharacterized membrane protein YkgB